MHRAITAFVLATGLAACQGLQEDGTVESAAVPAEQTTATSAASASGDVLGFVQASCGGCHAVEPGWQSPNPKSPTFPDIANRKGLTVETLSTWLRDAHNYPEEMDFDLTDEQVDRLAHYITTLRDETYKPPAY